jgi:hypothetical protein
VSSPIVSGPRSLSTPRSSPRQRLIMECVEIVPPRELSRLRASESGREKSGQQHRNNLDDHTSEITPERPLVPRVIRALEEKDEIGMLISRIPNVNVMSWNLCNRRAVPETPDAVLRLPRISLPAGIESSERFPIILLWHHTNDLTLQMYYYRPRQRQSHETAWQGTTSRSYADDIEAPGCCFA